jgi:hypothetical protein
MAFCERSFDSLTQPKRPNHVICSVGLDFHKLLLCLTYYPAPHRLWLPHLFIPAIILSVTDTVMTPPPCILSVLTAEMAAVNQDLLNAVMRGLKGARVAQSKHASKGGNAYPKEVRDMVLQLIRNEGVDYIKSPEISRLMRQKMFPCMSTCRRWLRQYIALGYIRPKRKNNNRAARREIHGAELVQLAFYSAIRPYARLYEVKAYLSNRFPNIASFSDSQIVRAEQRLGLSRKAASRTSQDAYKPINLVKRKLDWERPYPLGVADQSTSKMVDIDETRFKLESVDRKFGKCAREFRCNIRGKYKKGSWEQI